MVMVMGHRGARFEAPENTAQGFLHLMELSLEFPNIRGAELDIQLSKDGVWMVAHDATFMRKAGVRKHLEHMDAADIETVPLTKLASSSGALPEGILLPTEPMLTPRLDKVMGLIGSLDHIELEIKVHAKTSVPRLNQALQELLPLLRENVTLTSFNPALLYALKADARAGRIKTGWLIEHAVEANYLVDTAKHLGTKRICLKRDLPDAELIGRLKDARLKTTVWTVNKKKHAKRLAGFGVDAIITDEPKKSAGCLGA